MVELVFLITGRVFEGTLTKKKTTLMCIGYTIHSSSKKALFRIPSSAGLQGRLRKRGMAQITTDPWRNIFRRGLVAYTRSMPPCAGEARVDLRRRRSSPGAPAEVCRRDAGQAFIFALRHCTRGLAGTPGNHSLNRGVKAVGTDEP